MVLLIHHWTQLLPFYHCITVHWDVRSQAVTDTADSAPSLMSVTA